MNFSGLFRVALKSALFAFTFTLYFISAFVVSLFCGFNFHRARPILIRIVQLTSRTGLKIIGINVVQNIQPLNPMENFLIVSNHLSSVDILVISSFFPCCFVTSKEMKETFFLGQLCILGGCLFVDRKNRMNLHNEVRELTSALVSHQNVTIFPEATSTDGSEVIRFKRPLFQAAIDAGAKIMPICLNYKSLDGSVVSLKNRDQIFWFGPASFGEHATKFLSHKRIVVELTSLPIINAREFTDKTLLSEKCHELVSAEYKKINS